MDDDHWIMAMVDEDEAREERIRTRIVVDAYTSEEQAAGWHAYLDDAMDFPYDVRCTTEREDSPLKSDETVRVVGTSSTGHTLSRQFVIVEWMGRELGVPLAQLEPVDASDDTKRAIEDWHYWLER